MQLLKIEGTKQLRLLPWRYNTPGFHVRHFGLRDGHQGICTTPRISPSTYDAPDPLWENRKTNFSNVFQWEGYIFPYYAAKLRELGFVRLPRSIYLKIVQRIAGTPYLGPNSALILERLNEMPGSTTLAQALADANPTADAEWLEEPLDVTSLDKGCDIIVRKMGRGITTQWEINFVDPEPLLKMERSIKQIMKPDFDVLDALEYSPFNLDEYLEACRHSKIQVNSEVLAQLEKLGQ